MTDPLRRCVIALTLAALCGLPGCLDPEPDPAAGAPPRGTIEVTSGDSDQPHLVDFGAVPAGEVEAEDLTIRNVGTADLQLRDFVLSGSTSFAMVNLDEMVPVLEPGGSWDLRVEYAPTQDETANGDLVVVSNDSADPEVTVALRAEGIAPAIAISPPGHDFGDQVIGCVSRLDVEITNIGRADLYISDLTFDAGSGLGEMALGAGITMPLLLAPSDTAELEVVHTPLDALPDTATLTLDTNDPSRPEASATWLGNGHLGELWTEQIVQSGGDSTDILWVVDDSSSMGSAQAALASSVTAFVQVLGALGVDYQIGVVTADVADNGLLQGTTRIITPATPDPAAVLAANVALGTSGSWSQRGLDGAYLALSAPNFDAGGYNEGFIREEAALRIIFVSDAQDQSSILSGGVPSAYVSYLQGLKAYPDRVALSAITGGLTGCAGADISASSGTDYVQVAVMTSGISASICDPNWVSTLSSLAGMALSPTDTFELSRSPVQGTIEVRLSTDGVTFVPAGAGWSFDSALNAIIFDLNSIPDDGDVIEVEYRVLGDCPG